MSSLHAKAFSIAIVHYLVSFGIAFMAFASAWGSGLSDTYQGGSGFGLFGLLAVVLQAPVAIIQWLAIHASPDGKTGLQISTIVLIAIPSSLIYGYILAFLFRSSPSTHDQATSLKERC